MGVLIIVEGGRQPESSQQRRSYARSVGNLLRRALRRRADLNRVVCFVDEDDLVVRSGTGNTNAILEFIVAHNRGEAKLVLLLVDSDAPVTARPDESAASFLRTRFSGKVNLPASVAAGQVYLMVQAIEAWLIADRDKLAEYYGTRLVKLDGIANVEAVANPKAKLRQAVRTAKKRDYDEIEDCQQLLERVRPGIVEEECPHFKRLIDRLWAELCALSPCKIRTPVL